MSERLLLKGLEEEVYTGSYRGKVVGLSHRIAADLPGFTTEPDARNVEFTTAPYRNYRVLVDRLMTKRCRLRAYLSELGDYTLVPGGTLALEESDEFVLSNPKNPYYCQIRDAYGTTVVTASTHINIGIERPEDLLRAYRVIRCEAYEYLALTAASPFLKGAATGSHSTRWSTFPETPKNAPFFRDHDQFVQWMDAQLKLGTMFNPRHLWLSVRPNGPDTPYEIVRLELRICDRISDPALIGAVTGLLEARIWQILEDRSLDPLETHAEKDLIELSRRNEAATAQKSLDALVVDWQTGRETTAREVLEARIASTSLTAREHGFDEHIEPLEKVMRHGNRAQRWLAALARGQTVEEVLADSILELNRIDNEFDPECPSPAEFLLASPSTT